MSSWIDSSYLRLLLDSANYSIGLLVDSIAAVSSSCNFLHRRTKLVGAWPCQTSSASATVLPRFYLIWDNHHCSEWIISKLQLFLHIIREIAVRLMRY